MSRTAWEFSRPGPGSFPLGLSPLGFFLPSRVSVGQPALPNSVQCLTGPPSPQPAARAAICLPRGSAFPAARAARRLPGVAGLLPAFVSGHASCFPPSPPQKYLKHLPLSQRPVSDAICLLEDDVSFLSSSFSSSASSVTDCLPPCSHQQSSVAWLGPACPVFLVAWVLGQGSTVCRGLVSKSTWEVVPHRCVCCMYFWVSWYSHKATVGQELGQGQPDFL